MPLNDRDRKALKIGGIVAAVLVLALLGLSQLGKGGAPALPPLSVGPSTATGPVATGPGADGRPQAARRRRADPRRAPSSPAAIRSRCRHSSKRPAARPSGHRSRTDGLDRPRTDRSRPAPDPRARPVQDPPDRPRRRRTDRPRSSAVTPSSLIDTFTTNGVAHATVEVDGIVYNPAEGATFAGGNFELRDVAGNCATFLFGDESFTLCFTP